MSRKTARRRLIWLSTEQAAAYLAERLPPGATPMASTLRTWCKPYWRQRHSSANTPRARKIGRVWAWATSDLDVWIARRINGGGGSAPWRRREKGA